MVFLNQALLLQIPLKTLKCNSAKFSENFCHNLNLFSGAFFELKHHYSSSQRIIFYPTQ